MARGSCLRCVPRAIGQGFYRFTFGDVKELNRETPPRRRASRERRTPTRSTAQSSRSCDPQTWPGPWSRSGATRSATSGISATKRSSQRRTGERSNRSAGSTPSPFCARLLGLLVLQNNARRVGRYGTFVSPCHPLHRNSPLTRSIQDLPAKRRDCFLNREIRRLARTRETWLRADTSPHQGAGGAVPVKPGRGIRCRQPDPGLRGRVRI